jgi:hypothetical protein
LPGERPGEAQRASPDISKEFCQEKAAAGWQEMDWIFFGILANFVHARENLE